MEHYIAGNASYWRIDSLFVLSLACSLLRDFHGHFCILVFLVYFISRRSLCGRFIGSEGAILDCQLGGLNFEQRTVLMVVMVIGISQNKYRFGDGSIAKLIADLNIARSLLYICEVHNPGNFGRPI